MRLSVLIYSANASLYKTIAEVVNNISDVELLK